MRKAFERAKQAVEQLFWDTCYVELFTEETAEWGESLHQAGRGDAFPCRLQEGAAACKTEGLLAQMEQTVLLLYPADKEIRAGSAVCIRRENGEERRYIAAGESQIFLTHKAVGLRREAAA
nr:hypothetical protein [uncultured Anaerotignum sp.]